jgi:hypothetical protein
LFGKAQGFFAVLRFSAKIVVLFGFKDPAKNLADYWIVVRYQNSLNHFALAIAEGKMTLA